MHLYEHYWFMLLLKIMIPLADAYTLRCPTAAEWNLRATIMCRKRNEYYCLLCPTTDKYVCTRYITGGGYVEGCAGPFRERQGFKKIIAGSFTREPCIENRYQPFPFNTNERSDCIYEKSSCKDKGQIILGNGTGKTDRLCSCNTEKGFSFVNVSGKDELCYPSGYADCSCYVKPCDEYNSQSADVQCTLVSTVVDGDFKNNNNISKYIMYVEDSLEWFFIKFEYKQNVIKRITVLIFFTIIACLAFGIFVISQDPDETSCWQEKCYQFKENIADSENNSQSMLNDDNIGDSGLELDIHAGGESIQVNTTEASGSGLHFTTDSGYGENDLINTTEFEKHRSEPDPDYHQLEDFPTNMDQTDFFGMLDQFNQTILPEWQKNEKKFVVTHAAEHILQCIKTNNCVTVTGSSGVGKTATIRHIALEMIKEGYDVLQIDDPYDVFRLCYEKKKILCVTDDFCGKYLLSKTEFERWKTQMNNIKLVLEKTCVKLIIGCRSQIYQDKMFKALSVFQSCECNLTSDTLRLSETERKTIAKMYLNKNAEKISTDNRIDFFPMLCSLWERNQGHQVLGVQRFFDNSFAVYENELDNLYSDGAHGKLCALVLVVLFNNQLPEELVIADVKRCKRTVIKNACEACKLNRGTSPLELRDELDSLINTFLKLNNNVYSTINDRLFDFISFYFGKHIMACMIKNADSSFIKERLLYQQQEDNDQFTIVLPEKNQQMYIYRLLEDWSKGEVVNVFCNINMKIVSFKEMFLCEIKRLDSRSQNKLANKIDILDKSTVLIQNCSDGDINFVQWCIDQDADLNITGNDNVSPLFTACQKGHIEIVNKLVYNKADINTCNDNGISPLYIACQEGHIEIINILLDNKADINKCDDAGKSPLFVTCRDGHSVIENILLRNNADINKCTHDGISPLFIACKNAQTEIVNILLKHNADNNTCRHDGVSPLVIACQEGHTEIVIMLLSSAADVNKCSRTGYSPLINACRKGHREIVNILLNCNADVDKCCKTGASPLFLACQKGQTEIVNILLKHNADFDKCRNDGVSPLSIASEEGHTSIVKKLLNNMADVNKCLKTGDSPLFKACKEGHTEIVNMLLKSNIDVNKCCETIISPLSLACQKDHTNIINLLPENNAYFNNCRFDGLSPLFIACQKGHTLIVKMLLKGKIDVNQCSKAEATPLFKACQEGHTEIVKLLLNSNANVNECCEAGTSPLLIACQKGHTEIVKVLLKNNADIHKCRNDGVSPLFVACQQGHTVICKILLSNSVGVNKVCETGASPLFIACKEGYVEMVYMLLSKNADVGKCLQTGESPLHISCQKGHAIIVKMLLNRKTDINKCCETGSSPLYVACKEGNANIVNVLLNNKADVNKCCETGASPLHISCQMGHAFIVDMLLNSNADVNKCCKAGVSPLFTACQEGHTVIVNILLKNKANINKCRNDGVSPLFIAFEEGNIEIVNMLLNKNVDVKGMIH